MGQIERIKYEPFNLNNEVANLGAILKSIEPNYREPEPGHLAGWINYLHASDKSKMDVKKAVGLLGTTGTGKTLHLKAMSEYCKIDYYKFIRNGKIASFVAELVSIRALISVFGSKGFDGLAPYLIKPAIIIDDIGPEIDGFYYGSKIDVFEYFIEERYLQNRITHFSSNFPIEEIRERYGERVYSRIMETTNIEHYLGNDYRITPNV